MDKNHPAAGFTLIELSIVIIIIGLMTTAFLGLMKSTMAGRERQATADHLHKAQGALKSYLAMNEAYPCPAARNASKGAKNYGKALEECLTEQGAVISTFAKAEMTATVEGRDKKFVRIGILPFRSLGIPDSEAVDGWGNLLQYAVTETLTDPAHYDQDQGAIDVIAEDGQSRVTPPASVQYVVFSTGPDGARGFNGMGQPTGKICPANIPQTENCDDDAVFLDMQAQYGAGRSSQMPYDDALIYLQYDPDKPVLGGMVFRYTDSCPPGFSVIDLKGQPVGGVKTLSQRPPEGPVNPGSGEICYSSRYAATIMLQMRSPSQTLPCPEGWANIGYQLFGDSDPMERLYYQYCAR